MNSTSRKHFGKFATLFVAGTLATACSSVNPTAPTVAVVTAPAAVTVSNVQITSVASSATSLQLTAIARSSDGTSRDVTRTATWLSSNVQLATIGSTGSVTVVGTGDVDMGATFEGIAGSIRLNVARPAEFTLRGVVVDRVSGLPVEGAR